jgi:uncharacterized protein YkwD
VCVSSVVGCAHSNKASSPTSTAAPPLPIKEWDLGDPSAEAQQLIRLINSARTNPPAEGERLSSVSDPLSVKSIAAFNVDMTQVRSDFAALPPKPPLALDGRLSEVATAHAGDMAAHRAQAHVGSDGSKLRDRLIESGVRMMAFGENITGYATSATEAHDSFQIDWGGPAPTGVQGWPHPPHRDLIMGVGDLADGFSQMGIGIVDAANVSMSPGITEPGPGQASYGPLVVVENFVESGDAFVVGSVFRDADDDGVYDPGEGVAGTEVSVSNGAWYCRSASEGFFSLPLPAGSDSQASTVRVELPDKTTKSHRIPATDRSVSLDIAIG